MENNIFAIHKKRSAQPRKMSGLHFFSNTEVCFLCSHSMSTWGSKETGQVTVKFHFIFLKIKSVFFFLSGTASVLVILNNPSFTETLSDIENGCQEFKTITSHKGLYLSEKLLKLFQITQFHIVEM